MRCAAPGTAVGPTVREPRDPGGRRDRVLATAWGDQLASEIVGIDPHEMPVGFP
jgi:hypothetical protein